MNMAGFSLKPVKAQVQELREMLEEAQKALREKREEAAAYRLVLDRKVAGHSTPQRSSDAPTSGTDVSSGKPYPDERRFPEPGERYSSIGDIAYWNPKTLEEKEAAERRRERDKEIGKSLYEPGSDWGMG
jgi:hypothetical protein